jgi:hypothetical protein
VTGRRYESRLKTPAPQGYVVQGLYSAPIAFELVGAELGKRKKSKLCTLAAMREAGNASKKLAKSRLSLRNQVAVVAMISKVHAR